MTVETDLADTATETVRIPAGVMGLLRQSYDTREKVLDWCLAIGVTAALTFMFRDTIMTWFVPDPDPNAGRADAPQPSQDVRGAFPFKGFGTDIYTYNMPVSRRIKWGIGPSGTAPPTDPSAPPAFMGN